MGPDFLSEIFLTCLSSILLLAHGSFGKLKACNAEADIEFFLGSPEVGTCSKQGGAFGKHRKGFKVKFYNIFGNIEMCIHAVVVDSTIRHRTFPRETLVQL